MTMRTLATIAMIWGLATLLGGCQVGGSTVSEREGYYTWVDEQGRVRYSPIVTTSDQTPAEGPALNAPRGGQSETPESSTAEAPTTEAGMAGLSEGVETEFTLENYPDANELAKDGYVRPGERQPYFTWRDAQGNVRVSYFRPDTRSDEEKGLVPPPIELTPASVYHSGSDLKPVQSTNQGNLDAYAVLGIEVGGDYFERFREFCCLGLETRGAVEWQQGREFGVNVTDQSPTHNFLTGTSPYQMIDLASVAKRPDFIMRLRSYARNGVFVPSLAFLDRDFEPVRLVTDLVTPYEPETWSRRGFLEAWVPVFPGQGERWVVLYTRSSDLAGQTVIETGAGKKPKVIAHVAQGEVGLKMVEQD